MADEFSTIHRYFNRQPQAVDLGIGDDGALLRVSEGHQLVVSTDMLVAGTHFFHDADAYAVGWKALAVNVSDMAAMGASARWATLALALPAVHDAWLAGFSAGFFDCAQSFGVALIGGDTTHGPLNISVTIMGEVPTGQALRRDGAQVGDEIWVSGHLGDAALALAGLYEKHPLQADALTMLRKKLETPQPRTALGLALRGVANSAIDVSDGLAADLSHILHASRVDAQIHWSRIPRSQTFTHHVPPNEVHEMALAGGDDYELCFTAPAARHEQIRLLSVKLDVPLHCVGNILPRAGEASQLTIVGENHQPIALSKKGYNHFA